MSAEALLRAAMAKLRLSLSLPDQMKKQLRIFEQRRGTISSSRSACKPRQSKVQLRLRLQAHYVSPHGRAYPRGMTVKDELTTTKSPSYISSSSDAAAAASFSLPPPIDAGIDSFIHDDRSGSSGSATPMAPHPSLPPNLIASKFSGRATPSPFRTSGTGSLTAAQDLQA